MNTKIFCDIADLSSIKKFNKFKIVSKMKIYSLFFDFITKYFFDYKLS